MIYRREKSSEYYYEHDKEMERNLLENSGWVKRLSTWILKCWKNSKTSIAFSTQLPYNFQYFEWKNDEREQKNERKINNIHI